MGKGGRDLIIANIRKWVCPNCKQTAYTHEAKPHTRFHTCVGLKGLVAPLVEEGARVRVFPVPREDYVDKETVQVNDEGRPVMAVKTEHMDGRIDTAVLAPLATGRE